METTESAPQSAPQTAPPQASTNNTSSSTASPVNQPESVYQAISHYPFDTDAEFQAGLTSILSHPETPLDQNLRDDVILKAQCFYYARKFNPSTAIDPATYKEWKTTGTIPQTSSQTDRSSNSIPSDSVSDPSSSAAAAPSSVTAPPPPPPPYPTSFAAIVELITNNQPIPGIEEIPDTVLDLGSSKRDTARRRRKPWEKDDAQVTPTPAPSTRLSPPPPQDDQETKTSSSSREGDEDPTMMTTTTTEEEPDVQSHGLEYIRRTGVGVMHILSPDAVPDSGLVAKN